MSGEWKPIGQVSHIARYPLKSAGGEAIDSSRIGWHGVSNDRGFALLRTQDLSGLPWASARQFPQLLQWTAHIDATSTALRIGTPHRDWLVDPKDQAARTAFAEFATDALGEPLMLVQLWSGTYDAMPVSVISTAMPLRGMSGRSPSDRPSGCADCRRRDSTRDRRFTRPRSATPGTCPRSRTGSATRSTSNSIRSSSSAARARSASPTPPTRRPASGSSARSRSACR